MGRWLIKWGPADYAQTMSDIVTGMQRQVVRRLGSIAHVYGETDLNEKLADHLHAIGYEDAVVSSVLGRLAIRVSGHPFNNEEDVIDLPAVSSRESNNVQAHTDVPDVPLPGQAIVDEDVDVSADTAPSRLLGKSGIPSPKIASPNNSAKQSAKASAAW